VVDSDVTEDSVVELVEVEVVLKVWVVLEESVLESGTGVVESFVI